MDGRLLDEIGLDFDHNLDVTHVTAPPLEEEGAYQRDHCGGRIPFGGESI